MLRLRPVPHHVPSGAALDPMEQLLIEAQMEQAALAMKGTTTGSVLSILVYHTVPAPVSAGAPVRTFSARFLVSEVQNSQRSVSILGHIDELSEMRPTCVPEPSLATLVSLGTAHLKNQYELPEYLHIVLLYFTVTLR